MANCAGCLRPINQWRCPFCGTWNDPEAVLTQDEAREILDDGRRVFLAIMMFAAGFAVGYWAGLLR